MNTFQMLKNWLNLIHQISTRLKETIDKTEISEIAEIRDFNAVREYNFTLKKQAEILNIMIQSVLNCKDESELLDYFLQNIYKPESISDDIF